MVHCAQIENIPDTPNEVHRDETSCKAFNEVPAAVQLLLQGIRIRMISKPTEDPYRFNAKTLLKPRIKMEEISTSS